MIAREVEKLALYLDAASRPARASSTTTRSTRWAPNWATAQMSDVVDAALEGRVHDIARELGRFSRFGRERRSRCLRQIVRKLMNLGAMRGEVDAGAEPTATVKKRRLHFREEAGTIRLLQRWRATEIVAAIDRLRRAERALMSSGGAGEILSDVAITETTRAAARAR